MIEPRLDLRMPQGRKGQNKNVTQATKPELRGKMDESTKIMVCCACCYIASIFLALVVGACMGSSLEEKYGVKRVRPWRNPYRRVWVN